MRDDQKMYFNGEAVSEEQLQTAMLAIMFSGMSIFWSLISRFLYKPSTCARFFLQNFSFKNDRLFERFFLVSLSQ